MKKLLAALLLSFAAVSAWATVEVTPQYPADLNATYPAANDPRVEGDDHIRNTKTALKNAMPGYTGALSVTATDTGAANAYVLMPSPVLPSYTTGTLFIFKALNANTAASTLNVSGLGLKNIKTLSGADPSAGDISGEVILRYDGTNMVIVGGSGFLSKTGTQTYTGTLTVSGTLNAATQAAGDSSVKAATTAFVAATAFSSALPAQTSNSGKFVTTNGTTASWALVGMTLVERTSNTIITNADKGKLIRITSGTFSQTFDPIANFDSDFFILYENAGTGDVTHDPNAAETIDGRTTIPQYSSEIRRIRPNAAGTAWETTVLKPFFKSFTASNASAPVPTGYKLQGRRVIGGGGSGGTGGGGGSGTGNATGGGGGGGGGGGSSGGTGVVEVRVVDAALLSTTEAVVVGAGGIAQSTFGAGGAGVGSGTNLGNAGGAGTAGNSGGTSSSGAGTSTAVSAAGGAGGGAGKSGNFGNAGTSGLASSASDATAAVGSSANTSTGAADFPGFAGITGTAGSAGVTSTSGGAGGAAAATSAAFFSTTTVAGPSGAATQNTAAPAAGNNGSAGSPGTQVGQGGTGSSGGSGSRGSTATTAAGKGGDSAASGAGADGRVDWWGIL